MNAATQKFYQKFASLCKKDYLSDKEALPKFFRFCIDHDYAKAVEIWEFFLSEHDALAASDPSAASLLGDKIFAVFAQRSQPKALKLLLESSDIRRAVLTYSPEAMTGLTFDMTAQLLMSSKVEDAEELLKAAHKNTCSRSYGQIMKDLVEKILVEVMKKANVSGKKPDLPKKTAASLLSCIAKIRGGEKALLEQRIKELQN